MANDQAKVNVTLNGVKVQLPSGTFGFADFVSAAQLPKTTKTLTISLATRPTTVSGNGSMSLVEGDVITSS
jgi:hypothetical protein